MPVVSVGATGLIPSPIIHGLVGDFHIPLGHLEGVKGALGSWDEPTGKPLAFGVPWVPPKKTWTYPFPLVKRGPSFQPFCKY